MSVRFHSSAPIRSVGSPTPRIQSAHTSFLVLLPEDRARIDPRNAAAVDEAAARARRERGEVADARGAQGREVIRVRGPGAADPPPDEIPPIEQMEEPIEDPTIRDAPVDDLGEMDTDEEFEESRGDEDTMSDAPLDGPSTNAQIGIGGGAGGTFRDRGSRRHLRAEDGGVTEAAVGGGGTQGAVDLALEWLRHHQDPEGSWDADGFEAQCKLDRCGGAGRATRDVGVTGQALLAFLGAGETHRTGRYRETVRNGLRYLKQVQDPEGCFGPRNDERYLLDHAWAALAMVEAYAMTGSPLFEQSAQAAVDFAVKARNPNLGWGWGVRAGKDDPELTLLMVLVLRSAREAGGLSVGPEALEAIEAWLDRASGATARSPALAGAAVLARIRLGQDRHGAPVRAGVEACLAGLPRLTEDLRDPPGWLHGSMALLQVGGESWKAWNAVMKVSLVDGQRKDGDPKGSWDPAGAWGAEWGRVGSTALLAASLEVYYRYRRPFGVR